MEDGPEDANGSYEYNGKSYRLDEGESHQWRVFDDGVHIGTVLEVLTSPDEGVLYGIEIADGQGREQETTDDWQRAIETVIDLATF